MESGEGLLGIEPGSATMRQSSRTLLFLAVLLVSLLAPAMSTMAAATSNATPAGAPCTQPAGSSPTPVTQATPTANPKSPLTPVADVPLPGPATRFDYQSFDPTTGRLYIAHMDAGQLLVFDTESRAVVGTVDDLPKVTGVLAVPELHRVYAAVAGDHTVAVIDNRSLKVIARLGKIGFPDGLDYDPGTRRIFVSDESGGGELVIDGATDRVKTTIDLGGEAGNTHFDAGSGCILVAVQTRNQLVAIDPVMVQVAWRLDLDSGCKGPHGFLIDAAHHRAFVTCEDNAKLLTVDLAAKQVTAVGDVGDGPDVLAFDPDLGWLYVASESGVVSVFAENSAGLAPIGEYRAPHAHSVAVDLGTHLVYLPLQDVNGKPVLRIMKPGKA
jgi:DNA-binding beta-propeller fold protein YncE